jgi:endonuclease III
MIRLRELIERLGGSFARDLGVDLSSGSEPEIFKWFLASFLYGARISMTIAGRTYREFERHAVLTPRRIQHTGWDGLVQILDAGGYVRYDFSTATKLLAISADLIERYGGELGNVHRAAADPRDLEQRLMDIGKGIGPVTTNIFLRELRGTWPKARPALSEAAALAARHLGVLEPKTRASKGALAALQKRWHARHAQGFTFVDFEAALVRLGLGYCRKEKHEACPLAACCPKTSPAKLPR